MKKLSLLLLLVSLPAFAEESSSSVRDRNWGIYTSFLGDSTIPIVSLNVARDFGDLRLSLGAGLSLGYTVGIGAKYLFFRSSKVRPFLGFNFSGLYSNFASSFSSALANIFGSSSTGPITYQWFGFFGPSLGFDLKAPGGFNFAVGLNMWGTAQPKLAFAFVPFSNIGFFF